MRTEKIIRGRRVTTIIDQFGMRSSNRLFRSNSSNASNDVFSYVGIERLC